MQATVTPKRIAFFTAGQQPTPAEMASIQRLTNKGVGALQLTVMRGDKNYSYGEPETIQEPATINGDVRPFDYVAGAVPTGFAAAAGGAANYPVPAPGLPDSLIVAPATISMSHTGTLQLAAVASTNGTLADLTTDNSVTWSSSDPSKATVGAHTGLVTGVAAGVVNIVATIVATDGSGTTSTAHSSVTLT